MFERKIGDSFPEISHKRIESPSRGVYFNHIHNHAEILLFISGEADYNIDGRIYRPRPFDILFIPAATYHYLIPTREIPYENYVIGIDPSLISPDKYAELFAPPLIISAESDRELLSFFSRLDTYNKHYQSEDFEECSSFLVRELVTYLCYLKRNLFKDSAKDTDNGFARSYTHLERIIEYISENIEAPIDAEKIAEKFHLSPSYVQNMFSSHMHIGLKRYIMQKKIYAASADMEKGMSPTDASEKYGFSDYSVFYRLYKKTFHRSPRER